MSIKLNDMDRHVYCHVRLGASFGTQFGNPIVIHVDKSLLIVDP